MWPSSYNCTRKMGTGGTRAKPFMCLLVVSCLCNISGAQLSPVQQIQFVPKSYFFQPQSSQLPSSSDSISEESSIITSSTLPGDITRNPRHLAPDRYYVGPGEVDQSATATTSLRANTLDREGNPVDFQDIDQPLKLDISNHNPNNNQFEAKILPNSHPQSLVGPTSRKNARGKGRRNKTRPPKNVIIYSLPEQSFYAAGNEESSYSEPDSRESAGLRSDLGDEVNQEEQVQADSKEFRASQSGANVISQKKALLGQCMAQCIDAIL